LTLAFLSFLNFCHARYSFMIYFFGSGGTVLVSDNWYSFSFRLTRALFVSLEDAYPQEIAKNQPLFIIHFHAAADTMPRC